MEQGDSPRVLSIQSHVVSGYCGNKSATFPLQLLELEVDVINSVQLSNHTQYKITKGQIFESKDLEALHSGLKANNLLKLYDYVLSGYVADTSYIEAMSKLISDIKDARAALKLASPWYTLDPVLGDDATSFYVPNGPKVAQAYIDHLIPLADIITPNRFEASILTGIEIDTSSSKAQDQAIEAIDMLHSMGLKIVVITSMELDDRPGSLSCILSANRGKNECSTRELWKLCLPKLDCPFTGTGDLFAALLTGWLCKTQFDIKSSFEKTANSIHEVLEETFDKSKLNKLDSVQSYELRLIQNKKSLMEPKIRFKAQKIPM